MILYLGHLISTRLHANPIQAPTVKMQPTAFLPILLHATACAAQVFFAGRPEFLLFVPERSNITGDTCVDVEILYNPGNPIPVKVKLAHGALATLNKSGIVLPDVTRLTNYSVIVHGNRTALDVYLDSITNLTAQNERFKASGLAVKDLVTIIPKNMSTIGQNTSATTGISVKEAPNGYGVDCGHCHLCEEACVSIIWIWWGFLICIGACQAQSWCHHCD